MSKILQFSPRERFIFSEITILAWNASVQRARLYDQALAYGNRKSDSFRTKILKYVEKTLLPKYLAPCSEDEHIVNIESLVCYGDEVGKGILGESGYKFGVAQKLLNLLLKYLWGLGYIVEPPHCPVDRIVIEKTSLKGQLNWTSITTAEEYCKAISAIKKVAAESKQTLAEWELRNYKRR